MMFPAGVMASSSCVQVVKPHLSGGYCSGVPPLPIPNREVKPACADGTAMQCGRVGGRHFYRSPWRVISGASVVFVVTSSLPSALDFGYEQMIRYAGILLDIADGTKRDFDELIMEQRGSVCWLHFVVRPKENRRSISFDIH